MAGFVHLSYLALYHHYDRRRTSVMSGFLSRFTDQADPSMSWLFSYSPCTPFSEGFQDCVNVAVSLFIHGVQLLSYSKYTHSVRGLKSASVWWYIYWYTEVGCIPRVHTNPSHRGLQSVSLWRYIDLVCLYSYSERTTFIVETAACDTVSVCMS